MIARAGSGWQTVLADLSLILFMVTASALSPAESGAGAVQPSPNGAPLAVYRAGPASPPLGQWLADQGGDARLQLTIVAQYAPGGLAEAFRIAGALARDAGASGVTARIVVEPGAGGVSASLAYDVPETVLARGLRNEGHDPVSQGI